MRRYQELKEVIKLKLIWTSNEENIIKQWLAEENDSKEPIDNLTKKLPRKSKYLIKEKVHQLKHSPDRKKVVIRNQRKEKPKVVKTKKPRNRKSKVKKFKKTSKQATPEEVKKEVEVEQKETLTYFPNQGIPALFDEKKMIEQKEPNLPRPNSTEADPKRIIDLGINGFHPSQLFYEFIS